MATKKQQLAIINSIEDDQLDRAIKIAQKVFGYDDVSTTYALDNGRPQKIRHLSNAPDDDNPELIDRFFKALAKYCGTEELGGSAPALTPRNLPKVAVSHKLAAKAAGKKAVGKVVTKAVAKAVGKPAPKAKAAHVATGNGKIVIAGDAVKIAEALNARREIEPKGVTVLCSRNGWTAEAHVGKGVIIKGVDSTNLVHPLYYLRHRLNSAFLRRARVHVDLTDVQVARAGLVEAKDGAGYTINETK